MTTPLRVGVVGCGAIAQIMHLPYITEYEQFQLIALSDAYAPILNAVGDRYGVSERYTDWREMMARPDIDAVILTHSGSHHDTIIGALDAGKHVFVEKPMTFSVREAEEVAARAAKSDRIVQLGYHKMYDPAFAVTKDQIAQMKDLGFARITVLHPTNELGFSPHRLRRGDGVIIEGHVEPDSAEAQAEATLQAYSKGPLAALIDETLGPRKDRPELRLAAVWLIQSIIHQVYMLYGFLGDPLRVISADQWRGGLSIHVDIEYSNDLHVTLDWHLLTHLKDYHEEYGFFGNYDRVLLQFPSPYFRNFPSPIIVQGGDGELSWEKRIIVSYEEAFSNEILSFAENVRENKTPMTSVSLALKHMQFIQQIIDALK